ncbi:hypothetical protein [Thalassotalea hakodatensis]|uniref:hypothetical protein n=1 Tax=Thalassotalea hakodatensis TaxID=3030492 RepID=UPI0025736152|nr:hypothetical protein [Thalassotalea hakodatensis]
MKISVVNDSPVVLWYKNYVEHAYNHLDFRITFMQLPPGRGAIEANKGNIDALTIRTSLVEHAIPEFIRVPIVLATGKLMLFCQIDVVCDPSIVNQKRKTIGTVAGVNVTKVFMADKKANIYEIASAGKVAEMFSRKRLDYILTITSDDFGSYVDLPEKQYQTAELITIEGYHYLHKRHQALMPDIEKALALAIEDIGPYPKGSINRP